MRAANKHLLMRGIYVRYATISMIMIKKLMKGRVWYAMDVGIIM